MEDILIIRDANEFDTNAIADLITQLGYSTTEQEFKERYYSITRHSDYKTLVGLIGNKIVAMAGLHRGMFYESDGNYIRILALIVNKEFRKTGIAKKIIEFVELWAKETNATALLLNCGNREERDVAHLFYNKMGFKSKSTGYIKWLGKQ
jgi:GNAT superfamily N-acetyltransferase